MGDTTIVAVVIKEYKLVPHGLFREFSCSCYVDFGCSGSEFYVDLDCYEL